MFEPPRLAVRAFGCFFCFLFSFCQDVVLQNSPERFSMCSYCLRAMGLDLFFEELLNLFTLCALRAVFSVHWQKNTGKRFDGMSQRELFGSAIAGGTFVNNP